MDLSAERLNCVIIVVIIIRAYILTYPVMARTTYLRSIYTGATFPKTGGENMFYSLQASVSWRGYRDQGMAINREYITLEPLVQRIDYVSNRALLIEPYTSVHCAAGLHRLPVA